MKKIWMAAAAVFLIGLGLNQLWLWKLRGDAQKEDERMSAVEEAFFKHLGEHGYRAQRHRQFMEMMDRHEQERKELAARHEKEALADRISENLKPGSTLGRRTEQADEALELIRRQREETEMFDRAERR